MKTSRATEALRVAQEIAAIRAALQQRAFCIRKQPKQPTWRITPPSSLNCRGETGPDLCYLLTYQPSPVSSWVLHPQKDDALRESILAIVQHALQQQSIGIVRTS